MKQVIVISLLFCAALIAGCKKSSSGTTSTSTTNPTTTPSQLSISGMAFPASVTVKAGSTITWVNNDYMNHTVTEDNNLFGSGTLAFGDKFSYTFAKAGTFNYHCNFHSGMTGTIIVQ